MNPTQTGLVDIAEIERIIKKAVNGISNPQLQEEIIESIARAFNGDHTFLLRELSKADTTGRGLVDTGAFSETIRINCPPQFDFPANDIMFLALKYPQQGKLDINLFLDDMKRVMLKKGI